MTSAGRNYLYVAPDLLRAVLFTNASLEQTTERHPVVFDIPPVQPVADILEELRRSQAGGVVFELAEGLPSARHLQLVGEVLRSDRRAWIYWPAEQAVECVDVERLQSLHRHVTAVTWLKRAGKLVQVEYFDTPEPGFSDEAFAVGRITGLSPRNVAVLNFDTSGNWESEATVVAYDNIKRVRFETEYINVFAKYLPK